MTDKPLPDISGKRDTFNGIIIDEPDVRDENQKLIVEIEEGPKILVTVGLERYFHYGDELVLNGTIKKPVNFTTDQGKEFDYVSYLRKDGIGYVMSYPQIQIVSQNNGNRLKRILFKTKEKFLGNLSASIPTPESLLLSGLILGERSSFREEMRQKFIDTGTIHIVALSGYNVTIVAEWIMKIFSLIFFFLPRVAGLGAGIVGIFLFVIMAGGQATAVRAGTMAVFALLAQATGRGYDIARGLALAGVVMVLINPYVLVFDISFQLSFIATVAVIFVAPKWEKYFFWIKAKWLRDIVATTFSAYIFVLPFVLYKMGNLSLVALPANILVLPLIPITMVFGFLAGFAGLLSPYFSAPFVEIAYLLLHYELSVIDFLADVPFASFVVPNFSLVLTLLIYGCFIFWLLRDFFR